MKNSTIERLIHLHMALISQPLVSLPPNAVCEYWDKHYNDNMLRFIAMNIITIYMTIREKWCKYLRKLVE